MSKTLLAAALLPTAAFAQQLTIPVNPTMVVTATPVSYTHLTLPTKA